MGKEKINCHILLEEEIIWNAKIFMDNFKNISYPEPLEQCQPNLAKGRAGLKAGMGPHSGL